MMVVDTSALLAILECEPDTPAFARTISEADPPLISAALLVEAGCRPVPSAMLRYRVGSFRVVCRTEDASQTVFVLRVAHRKQVYR